MAASLMLASLVVFAGLGGGALLLLASGTSHCARFSQLVMDLREQRFVAEALITFVAPCLILVEMVTGMATIGALLLAQQAAFARAVWATYSAVFLLFCAYSAILVRRRNGAPCGCATGGGPASWWTVARAALLGGAGLAAVMSPHLVVVPPDPMDASRLFLACGAIATLLWSWPEAMTPPAQIATHTGRSHVLVEDAR